MNTLEIDAIFIDRDGTIGGSDEVILPGTFELFAQTEIGIKELKELGLKLYGFTNQPGISQGKSSIQAFQNEMKNFGFDDIYICPHQPSDECDCRKPKPGMLFLAAEENSLNLSNCIVIGDRWSDMVAANQANCKKILVLTGAGNAALNQYRYKWSDVEVEYIANNFIEAVHYIKKIIK